MQGQQGSTLDPYNHICEIQSKRRSRVKVEPKEDASGEGEDPMTDDTERDDLWR